MAGEIAISRKTKPDGTRVYEVRCVACRQTVRVEVESSQLADAPEAVLATLTREIRQALDAQGCKHTLLPLW